jgi:uncharacterized protein YprB with RNaseH-like and TPR domain
MPTLSDKLKALGVEQGAQNLPSPRPTSQAYTLENIIPGHFQTTPHGEVFVVEKSYDPTYRHGRIGLRGPASLQTITEWAREPRLNQSPLHEFVFLDTETTGLAGGTGTYAFLIGLGRFEAESFRLVQIFMRDPGEEPAQLAALTQFLHPCRVLVTFNGKSFDAPLLNTRYTLNRQTSPLPALAHLDLLPLARRLWPNRLPSRRLGDLETRILGAERTEEEVPGWLVPTLYFDYLRTGDARPLPGIFYHNAMDVLAMAALLNHMAQLLADPLDPPTEHALDVVAIARLHEFLGHFDTAAQLFELGLARDDLPEEHHGVTQQRLSFLHKRRHNWTAAIELWQLAAERGQIYAHVELAKFYEHKQHDYQAALHWTQAALDLLTPPPASGHQPDQEQRDLQHRLARLQRKLAR